MRLSSTDKIHGRDIYCFLWRMDTEKLTSTRENWTQENKYGLTFKIIIVGINHDVWEIYLKPLRDVSLNCRICLGDGKGDELDIYHENLSVNKWQHLKSYGKQQVADTLRPKSSRLEIKFFISIFEKQINVIGGLANDLKALYSNEMLSDLVMISQDNVEFKVHKVILTARSVVLKAHFEHNTTECNTNTIRAPFESNVLKELINYIYTDNLEDNADIADLLAAADFYKLDNLKEVCANLLIKKFTSDNVIGNLKLSQLYCAPKLESSALYYIKHDCAHAITETKAWEELDSVDLLKKVYTYVTSNNE